MDSASKPVIFAFTTAYYPLIGGAEIAIQEITKRLAADFRFFIFTARLSSDLARREVRPEGVIIRLGFGSAFDKFFLPFVGAIAVVRQARRTPPACFWAMMVSWGSAAAYLANIIRFWHRVPVLLTLQEGDSEAHIRRSRSGLIALAWRLALRRTDYLSAISTYLRDFGIRLGYHGPSEVIPNGVDVKQFSKRISAEERRALRRTLGIGEHDSVVITTSRLSSKNGIDILIRALAVLRERLTGKEVRLLVLGEGEERANLEGCIRELKLERDVSLVGLVPNEDVPRYLGASDIFSRPSRSEGLGNSFLEAMAAGLPVVGTLVGGIPDFLIDGENGLACRVDDPEDCAVKIQRLLGDSSLRKRLAEAGKRTAERYEWDMIARSFQRVFSSIILRVNLRVLIATPIFPPAIGGPARYAQRLAEHLAARGVAVSVLTYGSGVSSGESQGYRVSSVSLRIPSGLRHGIYIWKAFTMLGKSDAVLMLDPFIAGVPATIAAIIRRKPSLIRVEGDFAWESYVERTGHEITLTEFAGRVRNLPLSGKERLIVFGSAFVFRHASKLVFSSAWRKRNFEIAFPFVGRRETLIAPPWLPAGEGAAKRERVLMFAGRFVRIKNIGRLIRSFLAVAGEEWHLEIYGEGPEEELIRETLRQANAGERIRIHSPLSHAGLIERMERAHAFLLPSLSDVAPNVILDCIPAGTPFLMTRETGLFETLKDIGVFVNPLDETDMRDKLRLFLDDRAIAAYRKRLAAFQRVHSWDDITLEWISVIRSSL